MIARCFTTVFTDDVARTAWFYEDLLGMTRHFEADWFVILTHADMPGLEFGILDRANPATPEVARTGTDPVGDRAMVTFVVADCDAVHARAQACKADIVEPPTDTPYGQRRMILRDPSGGLVDVSAPTAPAPT